MKIRELNEGAIVNLIEGDNTEPTQVKVTYAYFNYFVAYERIGAPEDEINGSMLYARFLNRGTLVA